MRPGMAKRKLETVAPEVAEGPQDPATGNQGKPEAEKVPYVDFVPPCPPSKTPPVKMVPPDLKNAPEKADVAVSLIDDNRKKK